MKNVRQADFWNDPENRQDRFLIDPFSGTFHQAAHMKAKLISFAIIFVLISAVLGITPVAAQDPAYYTRFVTSITYQNVDTVAATTVQLLFYSWPDTVEPIVITRPSLPAGAGTSLYIGGLGGIPGGFKGSVVMLANAKIVTTQVQLPQSASSQFRPMSNSFSAGANKMWIASILKNNYNTNSIFSIQNADTELNRAYIYFYGNNGSLVEQTERELRPGATVYVDANGELDAPSFNGAALIEAKRVDNSAGKIVADTRELSVTGPMATAFEGAGQGAYKLFMPSAACNYYNTYTSYAVQNIHDTTSASVTVRYSNGLTHTQSIPPRTKKSFVTCDAPGMPSGFNGSATISSSPTSVPIVAVSKVYGKTGSANSLGARSADGSKNVALPYVRWTEGHWLDGTRQRTYIAVQNVGTSTIPANTLSVNYYDKNGSLKVTHTFTSSIAPEAKVSSYAYATGDPDGAEFGYYTDGSFGGSVKVICTANPCSVIAVARTSTYINTNDTPSEDYNGIPQHLW